MKKEVSQPAQVEDCLKERKGKATLGNSFFILPLWWRNWISSKLDRIFWNLTVFFYQCFLVWCAVKPGGGSARTRSKYNAPDRIDSRYRRGNRRWSAYDPGKRKPRDQKMEEDYWEVIATVSAGCSSGPTAITYSCNCPDYARKIRGLPSETGEDYPATGRQFTPRTFDASGLRGYRSQWNRFTKAWQEFQRAEYIGLRNTNEFVYRVWTRTSEKTGRDWSTSDAGSGVDAQGKRKPCKHIWMVIIKRGDPYELPFDVPEDMGF